MGRRRQHSQGGGPERRPDSGGDDPLTRRSIVPALVALAALAVVAYRLLTLGPDPATAERLHQEALALERDGRTEDAIVRLRAAVAHDPEAVAVNRDYQDLMIKAGRAEAIRPEYAKRAASFPGSPSALYLAARLEEGDPLEHGMRRVLELDPAYVWAHRALGRYYRKAGRDDDAARHLEGAMTAPGGVDEDARVLLRLLFERNRLEEIDRLLDGWWKSRPRFCRPADSLIAFDLGAHPNGTTVQIHIAIDRDVVPFLYALRIIRSDLSFRQISVRTAGQGYEVAWTAEWTRPGQTNSGTPPETSNRDVLPAFRELYAAATARLEGHDK